jgi:hypothetical protein
LTTDMDAVKTYKPMEGKAYLMPAINAYKPIEVTEEWTCGCGVWWCESCISR